MNIITRTTTKLERVKPHAREAILSGDKDEATHRTLLQDLPCFNAIECAGEGSSEALDSPFRVLAWNAERCLDVKESAALIERHQPDIVLLSEMDNGMARSAQKHTTKQLAKRLGMYYLYGVEFLELDLGSDIERDLAQDDSNKKGFHGNAILSRVPFDQIALVRFDDHGHWFAGQQVGSSFGQPRVGGRMALLALVRHAELGKVCVVSTHFESNADIHTRDRQMFDLTTAAEAFAGSHTPIIIGGDLNTGNHLVNNLDHRAETLFHTAGERGFHWRANPEGTTTRPSRLTLRPERSAKLDWFVAKGIDAQSSEIIPALDAHGEALSDHDIILADWRLAI
ncbi:endonuclease/exonuclease/phosphatase family protein [Suttonella sp. R2A3]|uniref:endonuclease/exonuclease/phosphatase family protein n=1 Tax=Suttonella sp. R2A3 TaxID=2908648 RepID=UPI001F349F55|nr:endonuclease/exonuclease/phosphatase family protein [Suttonella sp. R2A3]UJF23861.1 endonuclease/exonuclease/phosphatase family protein [Suttonella sp. R2A3]